MDLRAQEPGMLVRGTARVLLCRGVRFEALHLALELYIEVQ